jgi:tetratricopeptide (TPR) repeat protein
MTTLGKYEIVEELGTGSMGVIYRARDTILDRDVALKTIARAGSLDPELKERFYREARACAKLQHPNIVTVYDLGEQEGCAFIAMELLIGADLRKFITEKRTLPADLKIELAAGVCDGLQHAHSHGIIHRDLKPSNIFIHDDGRAKILDFGVARLPTSSLTMMGRVLGTPHYMAPEQIMGKPCDVRSDIFSLAIVIFEFLAYSHPFFGESIPKRILHEPPDSLLARNPQLPPEIAPVIAKGLEKDPAVRYQTAAEFGEALRKVLNQLRGVGTGSGAGVAAAAAGAPGGPSSVASVSFPSAEPSPDEIRMPVNANTEYKMSALLTALQEFDAAIEQSNVRAARQALEIVRKVAAIDDRFQTALKESITRLQDLESTMPEPEPAPEPASVVERPPEPVRTPAPAVVRQPEAPPLDAAPAPATPTPAAPAVPVAEPAAPPRAAAAKAAAPEPPPAEKTFSGGDATSLFGGIPKAHPSPARSTSEPAKQPAAAKPAAPAVESPARTPAQPPVKPAAKPAPQPRPTVSLTPPVSAPAPAAARSKRLILIAGGAAAALIIAVGTGAYLFLRSQQATLISPVATAESAADGRIVASPLDSNNVVVTLRKGEKVNVIRAPRSASQQWTEVQYVSGAKVYPSGVMRTAGLTNWHSSNPDVQLSLLETFGPGPGATEQELRAQINRYGELLGRVAGSPAESRVHLDMARLNIQLARLQAAAGSPNGSEAAAAAQSLDAAARDASLGDSVEQLRRELASLGPAQSTGAASAPAPSGGTAAAPRINAAALTARAQEYWEDGEYDQAERLLRRVLRQEPEFDAARTLLERVQRAKQLEGRE